MSTAAKSTEELREGFLKKGEIPADFPKDLLDLDLSSFHFPFGYRIVLINGKHKLHATTEEDYRNAVSQLDGIEPMQ